MGLELFKQIYRVYPSFEDTDFVVGKDSFEDVQINSTSSEQLWYFKNNKKGLIKRFILQRSEQTEKACTITLIKKPEGRFTPRFDFQIWNTSLSAIAKFSKTEVDQNLIKSKVSFDTCHENFIKLLNFIRSLEEIEFDSTSYVVVNKKKKEALDAIEDYDKVALIDALQKKFGTDILESDVSLLLNRKTKLEHFKKLLDDSTFFESERAALGEKKRNEDVWQNFFESNPWIFGYGLQLISCEGLDGKKLEQNVIGNDIIDGAGKRIDALLKTKGVVSKFLFCEIKTHFPNLLVEAYERPGVFVPAKELRGAVAQIQKTIHKVTLKMQENYLRPHDADGDPSGEEILFVKPRGVVVIGMLNDFKTDSGINYEKLSSFELYRQQVSGIEIITYDELYERAKFIVEQ